MTVVLTDGFDTYNGTGTGTGLQSQWVISGASLVTGRFGGQALHHYYDVTYSTRYSTRALPSTYNNITVGVAVRWNIYPTPKSGAGVNIAFLNSETYQCGIRANRQGGLEIVRPSASSAYTQIAATNPGILVQNAWHFIEAETVINNATGSMNLYLDGRLILSVSSANLANAGNIGANQIRLGCAGESSTNAGADVDFDDLYINDTNTRIGERRVETLYPSADVAQGWARSTGSTNYTLVDETLANGDTDYVSANSVGATDTYDFTNLSSTPSAIDALNLIAYARKTDATTRAIATQIVSNTTSSDGSNFYPTGNSYSKFDRIVATDPHTSSAWTASNVNNIKAGPKLTV